MKLTVTVAALTFGFSCFGNDFSLDRNRKTGIEVISWNKNRILSNTCVFFANYIRISRHL